MAVMKLTYNKNVAQRDRSSMCIDLKTENNCFHKMSFETYLIIIKQYFTHTKKFAYYQANQNADELDSSFMTDLIYIYVK